MKDIHQFTKSEQGMKTPKSLWIVMAAGNIYPFTSRDLACEIFRQMSTWTSATVTEYIQKPKPKKATRK